MQSLSHSEIISAVFLLFMLINRLVIKDKSDSMKRIRALYAFTIVWLASDALAYMLLEAEEHWWIHLINLLAYVMTNVVLCGFLYYCEAYIGEKTRLSKYLFRIPMLVLALDIMLDIIWYIRGKIVVYYDGAFHMIGTAPVFAMVTYFIILFYAPAVAFLKRKDIGMRTVLIICSYCAPVMGSLVYLNVGGPDLTVLAGGLAVIYVATILQKCMHEDLLGALSDAEEANKAKTDFLFNMSHDIRTPMNAILGFTNIAEKNIDDKERVLDCLAKTKQSGNLLLTLINSVLDMSRIECGNAETEINEGDVYQCFVNIESTLCEEASEKDVSLTFEYGEITDRYVYADFARCIRIFTNLISNAVKYTREGDSIRVRCEQASPQENGYARYRYTIEDNGIGMSKEFQKHMYEAFSRERSTTASGISGTGLGLSVCKTFVDFLHGEISCESEPGKGTVFTVVLPFKIREVAENEEPVCSCTQSADGDAAPKQVDFTNKRILVVEDNELNREIVTYLLQEKGCITEEAEDGSIAVQKAIEKGPLYYDLILMDIQMPVMNGYEATKQIRERYPDVRIPIIAISANAFAEDRMASANAGMDAHVAKPIDVNEMFEVMGHFIK